MTAGGPAPPGPPRGSIAETVQTTDGFLRHAGRDFLVVLYTAVRSLKLYPIENAQVQKALDDLTATTKHLLDVEKEIELRLQGEFIFVNATRLRLDLDNYASFSHILAVFKVCGIGTMHVAGLVSARDWQVFLTVVQSRTGLEPHDRFTEVIGKLDAAKVHSITLTPPGEDDGEDRERAKERAKKTYTQS